MTIDPEELANAQARARMLEHTASEETASIEIPANENVVEEAVVDNESKNVEGE